MKLKVKPIERFEHEEIVPAVSWTAGNELFAFGDDHKVTQWDVSGVQGKVADLEPFAISVALCPSAGGQGNDVFALACADGTLRLLHRSGREEKKVPAHHGAAVALNWNHEGSALVSGGEDGAVKVWSRNGMLRSTVAQNPSCVHSVCWSPDASHVLFATGETLAIKPVQGDRKQVQWKAHDGIILSVDWSHVHGTIVSCGEDCKYKVWDSMGRQLYQSAPLEHVVTAVAWAPGGDVFAVGSFNQLRLCDKTGWAHTREFMDAGSLMDISWSADGTQLAAGTGLGGVLFAEIMGRSCDWDRWSVTQEDSTRLRVRNVVDEAMEEGLEYRERVVCMSLGFDHLVVATPSQCYVYSVHNWNTPHVIDMRGPARMLVQADRHFAAVSQRGGVQLYSYDGRPRSSPKYPGLRTDLLDRHSLSVSGDSIAILDRNDNKTLRIFATETSRPVGPPIAHTTEIASIALSRSKQPSVRERRLAFIDRNRDLFVTPVHAYRPAKLATMVDSVVWSDSGDMLAAAADDQLLTWFYPNAAFVDPDLLEACMESAPAAHFDKMPQLLDYHGSRVTVRKADGAELAVAVSPYPAMLYAAVLGGRWEEAVRLCRFVKNKPLWACLAGMALQHRHLDTAELALAAIEDVPKLHYVLYVKEIPSEAGRAAAMALFRRETEEAEQILLQAKPPLLYRAVKMNIRLFKWKRALELAQQHGRLVDLVVAYRRKNLQETGDEEKLEEFKKLSDMQVDWDKVEQIKREERESEEKAA